MTSSTMAVPSRGRPRLSGSVLQIRLRSPVFDLWNQRKSTLGFEGAAYSEFTEFLLHCDLQGKLVFFQPRYSRIASQFSELTTDSMIRICVQF